LCENLQALLVKSEAAAYRSDHDIIDGPLPIPGHRAMSAGASAQLPYRPCVGVMLANSEGRVFVGKRIDQGEGDFWQMPQGGVDPGEDLVDAALRELWEETGVTVRTAHIVAQTREELFYDLPDNLLGKLWGGKYRGQRQTWFLLRFTGSDADIDLAAHKPAEFSAHRWVDPLTLPDLIVPFKQAVYRAVLDEFLPLV
jgi:putative (di)nucleoside polyphosphate hydrolase